VLGLLAVWSYGLFIGLAAIALAVVCLVIRQLPKNSFVAAVAGAGLPLLWVAWNNRHGPGTICHTTLSDTVCAEMWNPWPFVFLGIGLIILGVILAWWKWPHEPSATSSIDRH